MKTIKGKIVLMAMIGLTVAMIALGAVTIVMNYTSTVDILETTIIETAEIAGERVKWEIQSYKELAIEAGALSELANPEASVESKQQIINQHVEKYGLQRGNILLTDGNSIFDGNNYADRDYFK